MPIVAPLAIKSTYVYTLIVVSNQVTIEKYPEKGHLMKNNCTYLA